MSTNVHDPIQIGSLTLRNRIIMAPMQQNQGTTEAYATDYHVKHYAARAEDVSLVIIESTGVSPNGRLFPDDIGIFTDRHVDPLRRIVNAVHQKGTPVFIQLTHGGRKSWPSLTNKLMGPSAIAYDDEYGIPLAMSLDDIRTEIERYRLAARRSLEAGFDGIELHAAHGHLLHQFLSPLSNMREDHYGGSLENRLRLIIEVLEAIRAEVGSEYPVQLRVSASDFAEGGLTPVEVATALTYLESKIDAVHVSSGGLVPNAPLATPEGYQLPYASVIKQYVNVPVIAVGNIRTQAFANFILVDQLADVIAVGRPLMEDTRFVEKMLVHS
ncbi:MULTISPECIES: oxidoreductase [Paenibacillus]|uniref:NADH:flavin oxidoreductase/NADH oxidase n=2 Tax=Paenibacillus lactis TaxID=228574 RepID=G4HGD9_9BACL|nr:MULTISPECIES: NADH:flavin oxidoreductase [Paenibacillus]EHB63812.1 NADH:flavin oxidoreductase/NADH oxidase [Paenibacillus lactis 154]MBP1893565.1 NADPH2 dehydrogenase [Paenibacillus lactis]